MSLLFYLNLDFFFHFYSLHVQNKVKFGSNKIGSQQMHLVFGFSLNHIIMTAMRCLVGSAGAFEIFDLPQQVELKLQMFEAFFSEHLKWSLLCIKTQFQVFFFFFSILGSWLSTRVPIHNALTKYAEALLSCCSNLFWGGMASQKKLHWMSGWPLSVRT